MLLWWCNCLKYLIWRKLRYYIEMNWLEWQGSSHDAAIFYSRPNTSISLNGFMSICPTYMAYSCYHLTSIGLLLHNVLWFKTHVINGTVFSFVNCLQSKHTATFSYNFVCQAISYVNNVNARVFNSEISITILINYRFDKQCPCSNIRYVKSTVLICCHIILTLTLTPIFYHNNVNN